MVLIQYISSHHFHQRLCHSPLSSGLLQWPWSVVRVPYSLFSANQSCPIKLLVRSCCSYEELSSVFPFLSEQNPKSIDCNMMCPATLSPQRPHPNTHYSAFTFWGPATLVPPAVLHTYHVLSCPRTFALTAFPPIPSAIHAVSSLKSK